VRRLGVTRFGSGAFGALILLIVLAASLAAPAIAPYRPGMLDLRHRLEPPAWVTGGSVRHLLGTDNLGRDMASRILFGGRVTIGVGATAALVGMVVGTTLGLAAGFLRGRTDRVVAWLIDVQLAFPFTLFAIFLLSVTDGGFLPVVLVLSLATWVNYARVVRGQALSLRELDYVLAARAVGVPGLRILRRYVLPAVTPSIVVVGTFSAAQAMLTQAALSFLGIGVDPRAPSWGAMLDGGRRYLQNAWWIATFPGLAIAATVLAVNLLGQALRRRSKG
jgi:peptide/nickel transport system permease protein